MTIIKDFLSLSQGLFIHGGRVGGGGVTQGFNHDCVLPMVTLNVSIMMWLMGSQDKHIPAFKLFKYYYFKNVKGVGKNRYLHKLEK